MDASVRHNRVLHSQLSSATKQRRSGYEPSDTETEWHESPWRETEQKNEDLEDDELNVVQDQAKNKSPLRQSRRNIENLDHETTVPLRSSMASPARRRHSKSPYAPQQADIRPDSDGLRNASPFSKSEHRRKISPSDPDSHRNVSPFSKSGYRRHISPSGGHRNVSTFSKPEHQRHISPYKIEKEDQKLENEEFVSSIRRHRQPINDTIKTSERSNYSRRSATAPRHRLKEKDSFKYDGNKEQKRVGRNLSPFTRSLSRKERNSSQKHTAAGGEINEMIANVKISRAPAGFIHNFESTDSIAPGDIFFSRDYAAFPVKNNIFSESGGTENKFSQKPDIFTDRDPDSQQENKANSFFNQNIQVISASTVSAQTTNFNSAFSRQSNYISDSSGGTSGSAKKFVANRHKNQTEAWFSCINKGSCRDSKRSPEKERAFYEASVIEKAFVIESLRQFWADKHRPASLNGFTCHKQEALQLKQLAARESLPHILLKGPPGSGKKTLIIALLREIFGPPAWNISHDLRHFHVQETRPMEIVVPLCSSPHHVELNVHSESNAIYALMALVRQISADHAVIPQISTVNMKADYKVIVLYGVDKAETNIQHLIKWIMDCYSDACKLILCCEDDVNILDPVKSRCNIIKVEAPVTHEIMEVLIQIARKEDFELPMRFAAKVANKSKQNMRRAIMALEACKAHNYPFIEDQPIPLGWEESLVELASEILANPSPKRLFSIRGKFQKLLVDFVHPKLILLKLVEQFLKGVEAGSKRELYYWHAYYDKRLPTGTSALLKLEEFTAKFMSIHRRNNSHRQAS